MECSLAREEAGCSEIPVRVVEEGADRIGVPDGPASKTGTAGSGEEEIQEDQEGVALLFAREGR